MMLKVPVRNFQGDALEECSVSSEVFAAPIRKDILSRVVQWQLAKRRSGNHKAKGISDISGTTKKAPSSKRNGSCPPRFFALSAYARWSSDFWSSG